MNAGLLYKKSVEQHEPWLDLMSPFSHFIFEIIKMSESCFFNY